MKRNCLYIVVVFVLSFQSDARTSHDTDKREQRIHLENAKKDSNATTNLNASDICIFGWGNSCHKKTHCNKGQVCCCGLPDGGGTQCAIAQKNCTTNGGHICNDCDFS